MVNYIIRVASGKDNVGKSVVAINLALALASLGKKVLLIDASLGESVIGTFLGIGQVKVSFRDIFYNKLDARKGIIRYEAGNIDMLLNNKEDRSFAPTPDQLRALGEQVTNVEYDYIIADTATSYFTPQLTLIYNESLVISTPDQPTLEQTIKLIDLYKDVDIKYSLVLNRVKGADYELKPMEVEQMLSLKLGAVLPEDEIIPKSITLHKPAFLLDPKSRFSQAMLEMAKRYK